MNFDDYLKSSRAKHASRDPSIARSLLNSSQDRRRMASSVKLTAQNATFIFEFHYDALRELIDGILALDGYKSYTHMASLSYLEKFPDITAAERNKMDAGRHKRNKSKYEGERIMLEETQEFIIFAKSFSKKLEDILRKKLESK